MGINGFRRQKNWPKFSHKNKTKHISLCKSERLFFSLGCYDFTWYSVIKCRQKEKATFDTFLRRELKYSHRVLKQRVLGR